MPADAGNHCVVDVLNRIGAPRVLGEADIVVIGDTGFRLQHNVLQDGTKANRFPYLGIIFMRELDGLGVAAAFKIENAGRTPSVFVVADEPALGVRRKSGLARSGKTKVQSSHTVASNVGGAVHGKNITLRQKKVHHREDGLLHLASVSASADQHQLAAEIHGDESL